MEKRRPGNFPDIDPAAPLLIFSDYGGSHTQSRFDSYSYLLTQPAVLPLWERERTDIRRAYGLGRCGMEYKRLQAADRSRALMPWLVAADGLQGLLVTVLVSKSFGRLYSAELIAELKRLKPDYEPLKPRTIERMFRICHFLALLVSGLSTAQQELVWITDEDDIAANDRSLVLLRQCLADVAALYLGESPHTLHCGTTAFDNGSLQLEDLASIPDLVAGALADVQTQQMLAGNMPVGHQPRPVPESIAEKSAKILTWLALPDRELRRMTFAMWPEASGVYFNKVVFPTEPASS